MEYFPLFVNCTTGLAIVSLPVAPFPKSHKIEVIAETDAVTNESFAVA